METFSALLAICAGNSPVTGEFHSQRPVRQNVDIFFDLRLNNGKCLQNVGNAVRVWNLWNKLSLST